MGLLQKAVETYDAHQALAGKIVEGHTPLAPVGHTVRVAVDKGKIFEVTIDQNGGFVSAECLIRRSKDDKQDVSDFITIIPVTEDSEARSGTDAPNIPHPICDKLSYFIPNQNEVFLSKLEEWIKSPYSHPKLEPIYKYVEGGTILSDLKKNGCIDDESIDKNRKNATLVRWIVLGKGGDNDKCWQDRSLLQAFINYYLDKISDDTDHLKGLCMISGENEFLSKEKRQPGLMYGKAKLISANDSANFTYRGRFTDDQQAASVSYVASQKAHNALRWLDAEQGVKMGGRTFICWNPQGKSVPRVNLPFIKSEKICVSPTDYRKELLDTLNGWKTELPETSGVVIASFDAATTGRLSLTYYNELIASDFLERIHDWDETCCWWSWNSEERRYNAVRSPSLYKIVNSAFGVQRIDKDKKAKLITDDRILKQQIQRLLACRIDRALFPADIERLLVNRASSPQAFEQSVYNEILTTACAVIKKYHHDSLKEEIAMSLEKDHRDRSYQFGRLLAVMDKAERDTYDRDEKRETNASKMQSVFCQHPLHAAKNIEAQLERAYFPRLSSGKRAYYKQLIGEIFEKISQSPENEWNRPLGDLYLIGYYLQRNELYKSKDSMVKDNISEEEEK